MNAQTHLPSTGFPEYHPDEELIAAYASGALDEASSLVIASHLTLCPICRGTVDFYETVGGTLIEALPQATMTEDALAATLRRAKATATAKPALLPAGGGRRILPTPIRNYVGGDIDAATWRPLGAGIRHMPLVISGHVTARLLSIDPGRSVFEHTHGGTELTLVLHGSYTSQGQRYARGDIEMADETIHHRPVASTEGVCVCLVATDAPLRFDSWIGRLMQPFIGI